ncbi:MAG: phage integrase SAM-like domain and Arm DNA-binding domain-containing protein, partial [Bacteroidota bacterium]
MQNTATHTAVVLETRTPLKDGRYPVKLRVTHNRQRRYFSLRDKSGNRIAFFQDEFKKVKGEKPRGEFKDMAVYLSELENIAIDTIKELSVFSFEGFEKRFFGRHGDQQDLFIMLKNSTDKLKTENRISTAISYECAFNSLKTFTEKSTLLFDKIDISFLSKYEKWMSDNGNSPTTTGIYLRNLRTCFNEAIRNGIIKQELYPFGRGKYQIPTGRNIKKALSQNDISLIASYASVAGTSEEKHRDYWLFLFLCNGINTTDMANLKYENIQDDVIILHRKKTQRELKSRPKLIKV